MIRLLRVPPHIATATSQCLLLITTSVAVAVHFLRGNLQAKGDIIIPLALGVIVGAQAGAALSGRVGSKTITRTLALLLVAVSFQVLYKGALSLMR